MIGGVYWFSYEEPVQTIISENNRAADHTDMSDNVNENYYENRYSDTVDASDAEDSADMDASDADDSVDTSNENADAVYSADTSNGNADVVYSADTSNGNADAVYSVDTSNENTNAMYPVDINEEYSEEVDCLVDYGLYKDGHGIDEYDYVIADSNSRYLTQEDIDKLTLRGINYAKNEIYARHGRDFKSNELKEFFSSRAWYSVQYELTGENDAKITNMFNEYEKRNNEYLNDMETLMGTYTLDQFFSEEK